MTQQLSLTFASAADAAAFIRELAARQYLTAHTLDGARAHVEIAADDEARDDLAALVDFFEGESL